MKQKNPYVFFLSLIFCAITKLTPIVGQMCKLALNVVLAICLLTNTTTNNFNMCLMAKEGNAWLVNVNVAHFLSSCHVRNPCIHYILLGCLHGYRALIKNSCGLP